MNYVDQDDGTYVLKYTFSTPGDYTLSLRFGDENIPGSPFVMKVEPKEDSSEIPELPEADCPPLKKMRLETERDQKNYHLSYSRIIKLERENSFLRSENANLARLLKLSEDPEISKNESNIVFILDTNMLIHKLALVDKLKDSFIEGCPVVICLPYIVIQELDHLKFKQKNRNETKIAIHYVNEILQKHASYYGQSINQAKIAETLFGLTGDDKVLECCLGLSKQFKNVFLLTKDVNLANVAQFWGVKTYEIKRLEAFLKPGKNFGFKEIRKEKKKLFGQTSEEVDNSDDDSSSNPLDSSLTTSDDYSSE